MLHSISLTNQKLKPYLEGLGYNLITAPTDRRTELILDSQPDVFIHHNYPFDVISAPGKMNVLFIQYEYLRLLERHEYIAHRLNAFYDLLIVSSKFVKNAFLRSGVTIPIEVCPLGFDHEEFSPSTSPMELDTKKTFRFLNLGGAIHRKGLDILLNAYTETFRKDEDVCLVLKSFSYHQYLTWINEKIAKLERKSNAPEVLFTHDEPDSIAGYYTSSDVGVYPYRGEGFGLTILESLACGRPVIVTKTGSTDDFCNIDNAWFIPSAEKLIEDMLLLEPDESSLGQIMRDVYERGKNGGKDPVEISKSVAGLTWKSSAETLSEILEKVYKNKLKMSVPAVLETHHNQPALIFYNFENTDRKDKIFPDITIEFQKSIPELNIISLESELINYAPPWIIGITGQSYEHFFRAKQINPNTKLILIHEVFPVDREMEIEKQELINLNEPNSKIYPRYNGLYNWRVQQETQLADVLIVFDRVTQRCLGDQFPTKPILRVPAPISTVPNLSLPDTDTFNMLFVSTNPLQQGIKLLFEAWDQLKLPNAELFCVLSGKFALTSKYLLKILMKNPNIKVSGFHSDHLPDEFQFMNIFAKSHVMVNPAIEDGFIMLGANLFGQGKPLIVSDTSGMEFLVTHQTDGYVFESGNIEDLKAGIQFFYDRRDQLVPFAEAAHQKAQKFTTKRFVKEVARIIDQITGPE